MNDHGPDASLKIDVEYINYHDLLRIWYWACFGVLFNFCSLVFSVSRALICRRQKETKNRKHGWALSSIAASLNAS